MEKQEKEIRQTPTSDLWIIYLIDFSKFFYSASPEVGGNRNQRGIVLPHVIPFTAGVTGRRVASPTTIVDLDSSPSLTTKPFVILECLRTG